jgi:hypothetical protein
LACDYTNLLHKAKQELDDSLEALLVHLSACAEQTEHVDEVIIHCVVLRAELREEHARQISDATVFVLEALGHLAKLTLDLDLTGKNQERQCHETSAFHGRIVICQSSVEEVGILIDQVVKAYGHVAECDHSV